MLMVMLCYGDVGVVGNAVLWGYRRCVMLCYGDVGVDGNAVLWGYWRCV